MTASDSTAPLAPSPRAPWVGDLMGGVTSAVVALPLALAFAVASGVDPKAGLYTAIVAGIIGSLAGGSAIQITGPTGAMAVVLAGIVAQYGIEQVWVAGLMAGLIQIGLGVARLGRLVAYLPFPVITGFTNGIGVLIFAGQLGNFLGMQHATPRGPLLSQVLWQLTHLQLANVATVALTLLVITTMVLWGKINKTIPGSLISLVLATIAATWLKLDVPRIGAIPQGLPMPGTLHLQLGAISSLLRPALAIAVLGSIESLLSATVADRIAGGPPHDPDRELLGQGLANVATPFFGGIPATGAIARTAVNIRSGGKTRLSGVVHGILIALVVVVLGPLAGNIPLAVLAGILMVTSARMIEWEQVKLLAVSSRSEVGIMALTWAVTVLFDLVLAVEVGLMAAVVVFIRRMADVHLISHPEVPRAVGLPAVMADSIAVLDIDRPLFFGDAARLVVQEDHGWRGLVFRLDAVPTIDVTAALAFDQMIRAHAGRGAIVALSGVAPDVYDLLDRLGVVGRIGRHHFFTHAEEAVDALWKEISAQEALASRALDGVSAGDGER